MSSFLQGAAELAFYLRGCFSGMGHTDISDQVEREEKARRGAAAGMAVGNKQATQKKPN